MSMRAAWLAALALGLLAWGCGIKGPPKPPLEATAAPEDPRPDGGCCQESR